MFNSPDSLSGQQQHRPVSGRMWRTSSGLLDPSTAPPRPQRIDIRLPVSLAQLQAQQASSAVPPAPPPMQSINAFMRRQSTMEDRNWDQALAAAGLQHLGNYSSSLSTSIARTGTRGSSSAVGLRRPRTAGANHSTLRYRAAAAGGSGGVNQALTQPAPSPASSAAKLPTTPSIQSKLMQDLSVQQHSTIQSTAQQQLNGAEVARSLEKPAELPHQTTELQTVLSSSVETATQQPSITSPAVKSASPSELQSLQPSDSLSGKNSSEEPASMNCATAVTDPGAKDSNLSNHRQDELSKTNSVNIIRAQTASVRLTQRSVGRSSSSSSASTSSASDSDVDKKETVDVPRQPPRPSTPTPPTPRPKSSPATGQNSTTASKTKKPTAASRRKRQPALLPSLFPGVPAALNFAAEGEFLEPASSPVLERTRRQLLKWRLSPATPGVVRRVVARSGFKFLPKTGPGDEFDCVESDEWLGYFGRHMKPAEFSAIREYQKVNHFPGSFTLGRKDRLWQGLRRFRVKYGDFFDIAPATYCLPDDLLALRQAWEAVASNLDTSISAASASSVSSTSSFSSGSASDANLDCSGSPMWILKPPASCRGQGIRLLNKWHQVPKRRSALIQEYINRPYLIDGNKFDLRVYVYVTSFDPLRAYVHELGLVRFASSQYDASDPGNRFAHLTNYSVNKHSRTYRPSQQDGSGHKWSLQALWTRLRSEGRNPLAVWESVKLVVLKALLSGQAHIANQVRLLCRRSCCAHELFGFDILLDEDLRPWLLEVNVSPSLNTDTQLDNRIKDAVIADALRLAGFRLPPGAQDPELSSFDSDDYDSDEGGSGGKEKSPAGPAAELDIGLPPTGRPSTSGAPRTVAAAPPSSPSHSSSRLADDERAKRAFFCAPSWRRRLPRLLDGPLTPRDLRCLTRAVDEYQRRGGFERLAPAGGDLGLRCLSCCGGRPSYSSLLLHAFVSRYGHAGKEGINLLVAGCRAGLHKSSDATDRQLWSPPAGLR